MRHFDTTTIGDLDALRLTAEAMKVSDYELFVEAYQAWHGSSPTDKGQLDKIQLDKMFGRYLRRGEIPSYVRHFARQYLSDHPEFLAARNATQRKQKRAEYLSFLLILIMVLVALTLF